MMSDETTLLPCPFCKNEMHFVPTDQPRGWLVDGRHKFSCPFSIMTYDDCTAFVTREAAAESWNTRSDYAVQAENERKAELGSGTCEWLLEHSGTLYDKWRCSKCGYLHVESRTDGGATDLAPNFCPKCGREVVDEC